MTVLLVASLILGIWSSEGTIVKHFAPLSEDRETFQHAGNAFAILSIGCLIAAAIVG